MNSLAQVQEKLRERDLIKVARSWTSSSVLRNYEGRVVATNPEYHPPIYQTEDGRFVDAENRTLEKSKIPAYILGEANTPIQAAVATAPREMTLAEAMIEGERRANHANDSAPVQTKRPVGRPRKVK